MREMKMKNCSRRIEIGWGSELTWLAKVIAGYRDKNGLGLLRRVLSARQVVGANALDCPYGGLNAVTIGPPFLPTPNH